MALSERRVSAESAMSRGNFVGDGSDRQRAIIPERSVLIMTRHAWKGWPTLHSFLID
jgi:hypothetical protein